MHIRIDAYGQTSAITDIVHNDWLTSEFDLIWKMLGAKLKNALEEEAAKK